ncbi:hypothetical protein QEV69_06675 [Trueperella pyogenes]|uniref:hypothetical protein n=1 Tax=Trueperella pyogenes TaxID=1661 RepID=UPI003252DDA6
MVDGPPAFLAVMVFEESLELPVVEAEIPRIAQDARHKREILVIHDEVEHGALGARHGEPRLERHLVARHHSLGEARYWVLVFVLLGAWNW